MKIILIICLLIAPTVVCLISGLLRFPAKENEKSELAKKRWKHLRFAAIPLVISWVVYGIWVSSYLSDNKTFNVDHLEKLGAVAALSYTTIQFLKDVSLGLIAFLPLVLAYIMYLFAVAWSERRIRQEIFPLAGVVRLHIFEGVHQLLPYAALVLFGVSGSAPWTFVSPNVVHFNPLIAVIVPALSIAAYLKSFSIANLLTQRIVPLHDHDLARRATQVTMGTVKPGNFFRIRSSGYPYVQAYALLKGDICLSDYVIDNFTPQQRDAIIAHEVGHLQHIRTLAAKRFAFYAVYVAGFLFLFPLCNVYLAGNVLPKLLIAYGSYFLLLQQNKMSRKYELEADRFAVVAVGSEIFVQAMERLHEVNLMPRKFDDKGKEKLSHPSLEARTAAAIEQSGMSGDTGK